MQNSYKNPEFKSDGPILVFEQLYKIYQLGAVELPVLRGIDVAIKERGICGHYGAQRFRKINAA